MMSHDLDKSVKRKPKRRIVEDLSSDNSGSEDKTHHSSNNNMGEEYFLITTRLHLEVQTHHKSKHGFYQKGNNIKYFAFPLFFIIK